MDEFSRTVLPHPDAVSDECREKEKFIILGVSGGTTLRLGAIAIRRIYLPGIKQNIDTCEEMEK